MPAQWRIEHWPKCLWHTFLSHCAEDREGLVLPVFRELASRDVIPWIDRHHYPAGRDAIEALREELLRCRHVIYFITPAMLEQGRGWATAERALAATVQQQFRYGEEVAHVELPLVFAPVSDRVLKRSIWQTVLDKSRTCPFSPGRGLIRGMLPSPKSKLSWRREHIVWAADTIQEFVRREEEWALELAIRFDRDTRFFQWLARDENFARRVLAQSPRPVPPPTSA